MTCADARHRVLAAEISALRGESDRSLRAHLDTCPACAADASRVLGDTRRLGAALAARARQPEIRRARRRRSAFVLAPIGAAAAITLMIVTHPVTPKGPAGSTRMAVAKPPAVVKTSVSGGDTNLVSPIGDGDKQRPRRVATAVAAAKDTRRLSERPDRTAPAGQTVPSVFVDSPFREVGVTVGNDQRAAIIATSNPDITIVWLSRGQQP
jgi:hypothetical protein